MNSLSWYLSRMRKVPFLEYPYRCNQLFKKKIDKYFFNQANRINSFSIPNIKKADIQGFEESFPRYKSQIVANAEDILGHSVNIFGIQKDFGTPINWHLDPKTNNSWPIKFWSDLDYRAGKTVGGIKFAWELNRLHHLPRLAIAFSHSKDSRYKEEIFKQLESWLEANPYPRGIHWIMGIELGIRIVNVTFALKFLDNEPLNDDQRGVITRFISLHGRHLYRFPSKYSSCANHAVAEALGMFVSGLCFPNLKNANNWKRRGKGILEKQVLRQIYPDGSSFEHSFPYLQFVLDHYLVYYLLCREYGEPCGSSVEERLHASLNFISSLLDKNGNYPIIGDDDDGYLLKLWFGEHNNFVSLLNTGAVLFENPEWIIENSEFDQKTFFLLGKNSKSKWERLKKIKKNSNPSSLYFKMAGLAVIRDKSESDILFVGNSGQLGLKPLGGHGHADALSFWISVDGQPIFIDPGTYLYHSGGEWRDFFRSTPAHNTLRVDGIDQSSIVSDFMYKNFYNIKRIGFDENTERILWSAGHDGYKRLKDPVFHKRDVIFYKRKKQFEIIDYIDCKKDHLIESNFHLHPDCFVEKSNGSIDINCSRTRISVEVDKKWQSVEVIKGEKEPMRGWYSARFNHIQEANTLALSVEINGSQTFSSKIHVNKSS